MLKLVASISAVFLPVAHAVAQTEQTTAPNHDMIYWMLIVFGLLFLFIILLLNSVIRNMAGNEVLWKPKNPKSTGTITTILLMVWAAPTKAAGTEESFFAGLNQYPASLWLLVMVNICLVLVIMFQLRVFRKLIDALRIQNAPEEVEEVVEPVVVPKENDWMKNIMKKLTRTVPVEKEAAILTDHDYDGIRELDNVLPPWWVAMFYLTIVFAGVYLAHYHIFKTGDLQLAEYHNSIEEAEAEIAAYMATVKAQVDEKTVTLISDAALLSEGEKVYQTNCVACHGVSGEGGVGPNFADEYWIHGGSINDVFSVIKYGVPSKGMISWRAQLSPTEIQNVSSYLLSFQGTNPPNQKEAQGEKYVPEEVIPSETTEDREEITDDAQISADSLKISLVP